MRTNSELLEYIRFSRMKVVQGGTVAVSSDVTTTICSSTETGMPAEISVLDPPTNGLPHGGVKIQQLSDV